jgi:uncharacterized membrane protein
MVIMALDHVRDFFHVHALTFQPDDLSQTTVALFLTRWITHFCAPVFMFTAGASAYLWRQNGRTPAELSRYLWKRGFMLILLELTILRFAISFQLFDGPVLLTVLWALGCSMIALGFLSRLPVLPLAILSLTVIALHNLADPLGVKILHQPGIISIAGVTVVAAYPLIPWIAVMAAGFSFGNVLVMDPARRERWLLRSGIGLTVGFIVLRLLNVYGDPQPWSTQPSPVFTLLSFLRCTKYPPSLDFLMMTIGPALMLLAWFYRRNIVVSNPLVVIGRVPLYYFLGHMLLAHALTIPFGPANSYSLGAVYLVWLLVLALMFPACLWFGRRKSRNSLPLGGAIQPARQNGVDGDTSSTAE